MVKRPSLRNTEHAAVLKKLRACAGRVPRRIVFPEGEDQRIIEACSVLATNEYAQPILLGRPEEIERKARDLAVDLGCSVLSNPTTSSKIDDYTALYLRREAPRQTSYEQGRLLLQSPLYFAACMVAAGDADGSVAGAAHTTAQTVKAALACIGRSPHRKCISSSFLMLMPDGYCDCGPLLFADCAVIPDPSAEQLAAIAHATAETAEALFGLEPRVAFLSYSTKASALHPRILKVRRAVELFAMEAGNCYFDGELQADAALIDAIGRVKAPESTVAGCANVLIFPDLDSGNIGYKLVQCLAGAASIGPVLQGLAKPANDLSRGCLSEEVVEVALITALQADLASKQDGGEHGLRHAAHAAGTPGVLPG